MMRLIHCFCHQLLIIFLPNVDFFHRFSTFTMIEKKFREEITLIYELTQVKHIRLPWHAVVHLGNGMPF